MPINPATRAVPLSDSTLMDGVNLIYIYINVLNEIL
jgi:hypothetical protein